VKWLAVATAQNFAGVGGPGRFVFSAARRKCAAALSLRSLFSSAFWGCLLWCWLVLVLVFGLSALSFGGAAVLVSFGLLVLRVRLVFVFFGVFVRRGLGSVVLGLVFVGAVFVVLVLVLCFPCLFAGCVGLLVGRCLFAFRVPVVLVFRLFCFGLLLPFEGVFSACAVFRRGLFFTRQTKRKKQKGGGTPPPAAKCGSPPQRRREKRLIREKNFYIMKKMEGGIFYGVCF